jgi:hypothetical protein
MTQTLPQVAHEHHERILSHVDQLPAIADRLLADTSPAALAGLTDAVRFLTGTLLPHIDAAEATLYPELERMYQNRHSMAPMRREHAEVRRLVGVLAGLAEEAGRKGLSVGRVLGIRRVVFNLYAMLKIHLAEEEAYLRVIEHGVSDDVAEFLAAGMTHEGIDPA